MQPRRAIKSTSNSAMFMDVFLLFYSSELEVGVALALVLKQAVAHRPGTWRQPANDVIGCGG